MNAHHPDCKWEDMCKMTGELRPYNVLGKNRVSDGIVKIVSFERNDTFTRQEFKSALFFIYRDIMINVMEKELYVVVHNKNNIKKVKEILTKIFKAIFGAKKTFTFQVRGKL